MLKKYMLLDINYVGTSIKGEEERLKKNKWSYYELFRTRLILIYINRTLN